MYSENKNTWNGLEQILNILSDGIRRSSVFTSTNPFTSLYGSCSDNRTNNNQEGETSHQYIQEHRETQNNNEGTVDNATMKHASDKNESEDVYYTNTEDDIPLVKLCSFQKKQRGF